MAFNNSYRPEIINNNVFIHAIKHIHQSIFFELSQLDVQQRINMQITDVIQYLYTSNYLQNLMHRTLLQQQQQVLGQQYSQQNYGVTEEQRFNNKMNAIIYYADYLQRSLVMDMQQGQLQLIEGEANLCTVNYLRSMVGRYHENKIMSTPRPQKQRQQHLIRQIWQPFQVQSLEHLQRIRHQEYYQQQAGSWYSYFI